MSLRARTFAAVRWTALDAAGKSLLSLVTVAVLARILVPEDYGLMAIVTATLGIAGLFADLGVNSAYVQRNDVSEAQRSSLFWLNVLVGAASASAVAALGPLLAWVYGDARLVSLTALAASVIVVRALGQQIRMTAEKALTFRPVVIADFASALIGLVVAIAAALAGWGVYSLVVSTIVGASLATLSYWVFVSGGWRPARRLLMDDVRPFLGFGGASVGNNVVNYVNRSLDIFLAGRLLSASLLGIYSVPRMLVLEQGNVVNAIVTRVGFPLIAQVQSDIPRVRSIYLQTINMTAAINAPLYLGIAFFAPEIVGIALGSGWERSAGLLRILAVWGCIRSTGNPVGSLLYGTGRAGLALRWNACLMFVFPPVIWFGSGYGPEGVAWALLITQAALFVPAWFWLVRPACRATLREYASAALKPAVLAVVSVFAGYAAAEILVFPLARLLLGAVVSGPVYLLLSYAANRPWLVTMGELAGRRGESGSP